MKSTSLLSFNDETRNFLIENKNKITDLLSKKKYNPTAIEFYNNILNQDPSHVFDKAACELKNEINECLQEAYSFYLANHRHISIDENTLKYNEDGDELTVEDIMAWNEFKLNYKDENNIQELINGFSLTPDDFRKNIKSLQQNSNLSIEMIKPQIPINISTNDLLKFKHGSNKNLFDEIFQYYSQEISLHPFLKHFTRKTLRDQTQIKFLLFDSVDLHTVELSSLIDILQKANNTNVFTDETMFYVEKCLICLPTNSESFNNTKKIKYKNQIFINLISKLKLRNDIKTAFNGENEEEVVYLEETWSNFRNKIIDQAYDIIIENYFQDIYCYLRKLSEKIIINLSIRNFTKFINDKSILEANKYASLIIDQANSKLHLCISSSTFLSQIINYKDYSNYLNSQLLDHQSCSSYIEKYKLYLDWNFTSDIPQYLIDDITKHDPKALFISGNSNHVQLLYEHLSKSFNKNIYFVENSFLSKFSILYKNSVIDENIRINLDFLEDYSFQSKFLIALIQNTKNILLSIATNSNSDLIFEYKYHYLYSYLSQESMEIIKMRMKLLIFIEELFINTFSIYTDITYQQELFPYNASLINNIIVMSNDNSKIFDIITAESIFIGAIMKNLQYVNNKTITNDLKKINFELNKLCVEENDLKLLKTNEKNYLTISKVVNIDKKILKIAINLLSKKENMKNLNETLLILVFSKDKKCFERLKNTRNIENIINLIKLSQNYKDKIIPTENNEAISFLSKKRIFDSIFDNSPNQVLESLLKDTLPPRIKDSNDEFPSYTDRESIIKTIFNCFEKNFKNFRNNKENATRQQDFQYLFNFAGSGMGKTRTIRELSNMLPLFKDKLINQEKGMIIYNFLLNFNNGPALTEVEKNYPLQIVGYRMFCNLVGDHLKDFNDLIDNKDLKTLFDLKTFSLHNIIKLIRKKYITNESDCMVLSIGLDEFQFVIEKYRDSKIYPPPHLDIIKSMGMHSVNTENENTTDQNTIILPIISGTINPQNSLRELTKGCSSYSIKYLNYHIFSKDVILKIGREIFLKKGNDLKFDELLTFEKMKLLIYQNCRIPSLLNTILADIIYIFSCKTSNINEKYQRFLLNLKSTQEDHQNKTNNHISSLDYKANNTLSSYLISGLNYDFSKEEFSSISELIKNMRLCGCSYQDFNQRLYFLDCDFKKILSNEEIFLNNLENLINNNGKSFEYCTAICIQNKLNFIYSTNDKVIKLDQLLPCSIMPKSLASTKLNLSSKVEINFDGENPIIKINNNTSFQIVDNFKEENLIYFPQMTNHPIVDFKLKIGDFIFLFQTKINNTKDSKTCLAF